MLRSKIARLSAVAFGGIMCVLTTEARATGDFEIPVALPAAALTAPLTCTATVGSGTVTIQAGADGLPVPHDVPCPGGTGTCSEYTYRFTSSTGSTLLKSFLSLSSDVTIYEASPAGVILINDCIADKTPTNGLLACAQREARFNSSASPLNAKVVVSRSASRVATTGAFVGFHSGFCLIQGPGVPGGTFTPYAAASTLKLGGGKLDVSVTYGADGLPVGGQCLSGLGTTCFEGSPVGDLMVNGEVLRDFKIITFGDNTTTCIKGNPTRCYCTKAPCP